MFSSSFSFDRSEPKIVFFHSFKGLSWNHSAYFKLLQFCRILRHKQPIFQPLSILWLLSAYYGSSNLTLLRQFFFLNPIVAMKEAEKCLDCQDRTDLQMYIANVAQRWLSPASKWIHLNAFPELSSKEPAALKRVWSQRTLKKNGGNNTKYICCPALLDLNTNSLVT